MMLNDFSRKLVENQKVIDDMNRQIPEINRMIDLYKGGKK